MAVSGKILGSLVEYLDRGKLRPGLVVRENAAQIGVIDTNGHEKLIQRDLVLLIHPDRKATPANVAAVIAEIGAERAKLAAELDLHLLWEVVHEHNRSFTAAELAELFFGRRSSVTTAVTLDALLADRIYFTRRHMEFMPREPAQVERLTIQVSRERLRSESSRRMRALIREVLDGEPVAPSADVSEVIKELQNFLSNPHTRKPEIEAILAQAVPEVAPAEVAYEVLERMGAAPAAPRFAAIGGFPTSFSRAAIEEAAAVTPVPREPAGAELFSITIDDEETVEIDDAIACAPEADGSVRVLIHIALCADFVPRGGPMDREAAARAATVYLPEATIRMLPDEISCRRASLLAGAHRHVLTTEVRIGRDGAVLEWKIYPNLITVGVRLDYDAADRILDAAEDSDAAGETLRRLNAVAALLRDRRRRSGASLYSRREPKVRVRNGQVEVEIIDSSSPARLLVAEFMVLSNYIAAQYAAKNKIPVIYRVQPGNSGEFMMQRARLSIYPEGHAGIGLDCYAQLSSPIRRYSDLVLQRQLLAALTNSGTNLYDANELLGILANVEAAEAESKELERRARRYWILRHLEQTAIGRPLLAISLRDGATAELSDFAVRGSLHGAPALPESTQILVRIERIDPLRGGLALSYVETVQGAPR
jgi:exoribonuclease-2